MKLLRWRKDANSSSLLSLTVADIGFSIALIILWDTLLWRARLLITYPCMFISGSSMALFLPPAGSLALLLSSSDSSILFHCQSLTLLGSTEKRLATASPDFTSAYFTTETSNLKSGAMAIISVRGETGEGLTLLSQLLQLAECLQ